MFEGRPMVTWECVEVCPKDTQGKWGDAKVNVLIWDNCQHNEVKEVTPDLIHVCIGIHKQGGKAGRGKGAKSEQQERVKRELVGFFREILNLGEGSPQDQIRIERESHKTKLLVVSGLDRDKRSLLWLLQSKVGQKLDAHWAVDFANAALAAGNKEALKRKSEIDDFQRLQEEEMASKKDVPRFGSDPRAQRTKKLKAEEKATPATSEEKEALSAAPIAKSSSAAPSDGQAVVEGSLLGGLPSYDSESSDGSEESENGGEKLVNPFAT
ncbi:unnamed protein product, partial [Polarella glacialis]|uniref:Uncharacterized protein n=1 Tax=Polarella glacialis TaxID=89957 RepID=A0A813FP80_POLGL